MTTDVIISCRCAECDGAEAVITAPKYKHISRLPPPLHEHAIHDAAVTKGGRTKTT
jgi:hypothetical protein